MAVYGNFETIEPVFRTHHGSIWTARTAGTGESADCCIKLVELDQDMLSQRDTSLAKDLLVAAALQQAMGNKSACWAQVYGLGSQGTNAFYVSRWFPRSLQTLIDNKTALTASELKTILLAIVEGLIDLETAVGRSHSNLKPSNVLLDDADTIRHGGVLLCDPDPSTENHSSSSRAPDTKALGQILYGLVTHKPYFTARWPLPVSDHWTDLGSSGRQWRMLCESLLRSASGQGLSTLEQLRDRIDSIQPTRRRMPVTAMMVTVALAALGTAAYVQRDQLPGWYQIAHDKVLALMGHKPHQPSSRILAAGPVPARPTPDRAPTTGPAIAASQLLLPSDQGKPPFLPPPWIPSTQSAITAGPTTRSENTEALNVIQQAQPPEFHSDAARDEFIHDRDAYVSSHAAAESVPLLIEWEKIRARLQRLDTDYPPTDPISTLGWPVELASVMNARRDADLSQAIDSAFLLQRTDPTHFQETLHRVQSAGNAVIAARDAMTRGDIAASEKAIALCNTTLREFPSGDADLADLFAPAKKEFSALDDVANTPDRATLLAIADNEDAALAVRLSAWFHVTTVSMDPWPADFSTLAGDQLRAGRLNTLLQEAGSVDIATQVTGAEATRQTGFFSRLHDQPSVLAAVKQAIDPRNAKLLAKAPVWFRYDAALYVLQNTPPADVTPEQKQAYLDLSGQVDAPGIQLVHDALKSSEGHAPTLAQSGPGSLKTWQLRAGWTRDHCTFISTTTRDALEFLRVHLQGDSQGIDYYLCTTATPVALMQHLLDGDSAAISTAESLNAPPLPPRLWNFNDKTSSVDLDEDDYRKCFVVSPTDQLPVQMITPQMAFYLARRFGCRLPTSQEWTTAWQQAKNSTDDNMKGFATLGWKLRDVEFARLLTNPNRDADTWPDDNIFLGNLDASRIPRHANAAAWTAAALHSLGGSAASDHDTAPAMWPLSTLQNSDGFGFRSVGDKDNFSGVFHDLIGNVGEYVMDTPVMLSEKVDVNPPLSSADATAHVNDWFSPQRLAAVSVIGGSALSPPELDPTKPYPLPRDQNQFSDVGFRLAFTDPASLPAALRQVIGQATYLTAP